MKQDNQALRSKSDKITPSQASQRLEAWGRFYKRLTLGILITGQSGLLIMAIITWAKPDYRITFSTLFIYEVCILSAFVLAAFVNDRVKRRFGDMQHTMTPSPNC